MAWQGYKVVGKLGEGGMATVYKAIQTSLQRPVAIKILSANLSAYPDILERFERESLIIARLNHPHIIHVIDRGVTGKGRPYFVMEYVEGMTLEEAINKGALDFQKKLEVVMQVCKALAYAHKNGVIHRDIKPGNILIDADGHARMVDFGIAHFYEPSRQASASQPTQVGDVMGTVAYMSPEQQRSAEAATARSDLYSFGVVMYELFTGTRPVGRFKRPSELEPKIPPEVDDIILRCLEVDPNDRPASAEEIRNAFLKVMRGGHLSRDQRDRAALSAGNMESQFELLDVIREDRHGSVYLYEDQAKRKLLILKKLPPGAPGFKENKLLSRLQHPFIVRTLGVTQSDQGLVIVSEYVAGGSLAEQMAVPVSWQQMLEWMRDVAEALAFAHRHRIVHGNLRPSNILIGDNNRARVTDFGLQPHYPNSEPEPNWYALPDEKGTPAGDLFSLGAVAIHAITGQPPQFRAGRLIRSKKFTQLHEAVQEVLLKMVAVRRDQRYVSMDQALVDIRKLCEIQKTLITPSQARKIRKNVQQAAKKAEREAYRIPWGRWLTLLAFTLLVAEEYLLGYGYSVVWPWLLEQWQQLGGEKAVLQWSDETLRNATNLLKRD